MTASTHIAISELGHLLGYPNIKKGVCHGMVLTWFTSCMLGEQDKYIQRVEKITKDIGLADAIHEVKDKVKRHETLSPDDEELVEILSFLEVLTLSHCPDAFSDVFNKRVLQFEINHLSKLTASDKMKAKGGLKGIYSEPGIYSDIEISAYLDSLAHAIDLCGYKDETTIGFVLSNHEHAIGLIYNVMHHNWAFMDINQWPPLPFNSFDKTEMAKKIHIAFTSLSYTVFNTQIITTANDPNLSKLANKLKAVKKSHIISKEMTARDAILDLVNIAAFYGHASIIAELAKQGIPLDIANKDDETPAFYASQNNHANVIEEIGKHAANLSKAKKSKTPAWFAALLGNNAVIANLIKHGADVETPTCDGVTPLYAAAVSGHAKVVAEYAKKGFNLDKPCSFHVSPIDGAALAGHAKVVAVLGVYGAKPGTVITKMIKRHKDVIAVIEFNRILRNIGQKKAQFVKSGHLSEARAIEKVHKKLVTATLNYFTGKTNKKNYAIFKKSCNRAIEKALPALENHRGCKELLVKLAMAILSLGLIYATVAVVSKIKTGHYSFHLFKTDSTQQLKKMAQKVNNEIRPKLGA